jgi:hypothetical protein
MATLAAAAKCRHYYSPMLRLLPLLALLGLLALLLVTGCGAGHNATGLTYFLVSETVPWLGDSYLLPLADPEDIAHARALIADPRGAGAPIVVARIARGSSDGITDNRDLLRGGPGMSASSWALPMPLSRSSTAHRAASKPTWMSGSS